MANDFNAARGSSTNAYLELAEHMRMKADQAVSPEARAEFTRLATLYAKLAVRTGASTRGEPPAPPLERYSGSVRLPLEETYFHYTEESARAHAPQAAGVYALWNRDFWVYVGQTSNIQERVLQHFAQDNECVTKERPTAFGFELIDDPVERASRHTALIRDLMPIC